MVVVSSLDYGRFRTFEMRNEVIGIGPRLRKVLYSCDEEYDFDYELCEGLSMIEMCDFFQLDVVYGLSW